MAGAEESCREPPTGLTQENLGSRQELRAEIMRLIEALARAAVRRENRREVKNQEASGK
jgi:hypothetical protein